MKRLLLTILLLCSVAVCADAQWYLFPGKRSKKAPKEQKERKEQAQPQAIPQQESAIQAPDTLSLDSQTSESEFDLFERLFRETPSVYKLSLVLPFKSGSDSPSANYLEMYSGALLALREFGSRGVQVQFSALDSSLPLDYSQLLSSDLIIGPIAGDQISSVLDSLDVRKAVVSPLDPKNSSLASERQVVQSPTSWEAQIDELASWVDEEISNLDELIVIKDSTASADCYRMNYVLNALRKRNLRFREVRRVGELEMNKLKSYRILVASDSDAFLTGAVRSVAIAAARKTAGSIILYCSSRARRSISSNVSDLHDASTRLTAAYHIDYSSPAVQDFVLSYRSVFNREPGSFAFQGYDLVRYYLSAYLQYGRGWYRHLSDFPQKGLQSDFLFSPEVSGGRQNLAVRRIIYKSDLSTELL